MKKLISSISLIVGILILGSLQASAQHYYGNGNNHNGHWNNNGNWGNQGNDQTQYAPHDYYPHQYSENCHQTNYGHPGHRPYRQHRPTRCQVNYSYSFTAPCQPVIVVYRPAYCAPAPPCRRW